MRWSRWKQTRYCLARWSIYRKYFPSIMRLLRVKRWVQERVINRAAISRAQFMIYPWFIIFLSFCLRPGADRRSAILKIGVNHATCHVYSLKAVERLINVQCYEYVIIFSFRFTRFYSRWKEYQMRKKGIKSAMEFSDTAAFSFATWETWLDSVYFGRSDSLFSSLCIFCNFRQPSANLKSRNL